MQSGFQDAGVPTRLLRFDGVIHGFFSMNGAIDQADDAHAFAAGEMKTSLRAIRRTLAMADDPLLIHEAETCYTAYAAGLQP